MQIQCITDTFICRNFKLMDTNNDRMLYLIYRINKDFKTYREVNYRILAEYSKELMELFSAQSSMIENQSLDQTESQMNDVKPAFSFTEELNEITKMGVKDNFISTGYLALDELIGGFGKGEIIIIAARPGMGKSAFMLNLINNITLDQKKPSLLITYELTGISYLSRLLSVISGILPLNLRSGKISESEKKNLDSAMKRIESSSLFINDSPDKSVYDIKDMIRHKPEREDIKMVFIDNLLLIPEVLGKWASRDAEISFTMRKLKQQARQLNIPIVMTTNLNRAVEYRAGYKSPVLSDLRESGSIEQDADKVLFIYRDEYYKLEQDWNGNPTFGKAKIIIAKNRNGPTGEINLHFEQHKLKYSDFKE